MKKPILQAVAIAAFGASCLFAADAAKPATAPATAPVTAPATKPAKPPLKIIPGKVIVPFDEMRRPWGELISLDPVTRTGKFRREGTDEVMSFTVMPYAELLHHAAFGDLEDFRIGERVIFRLHPNEAGEWVWLTYIQDEMNMMNGHKEFFHVDAIDADKSQITCTQANADKSYVRSTGLVLETDAQTRFWKDAKPAAFTDIKVGDKLRTKTHGAGSGARRICWEVFLDEASLLQFQAEQKAVHAARLSVQGAPGYVDTANGATLELTVFHEAMDFTKTLRPKQKIQIAPAGVDRKPTATAVGGTISAAKMAGNLCKVTITLDSPSLAMPVGGVIRLWRMP